MSNRGRQNRLSRRENTPEVINFCEDNGFSYKWIDGDWQLRIEGVMDVYPGKKRYAWLAKNEWGYYRDYDDLGRIMLEHMT